MTEQNLLKSIGGSIDAMEVDPRSDPALDSHSDLALSLLESLDSSVDATAL